MANTLAKRSGWLTFAGLIGLVVKAATTRDDDNNGAIDDRFGADFVKGKGSGDDKNGHGTHVAGIIGARGDNDRGVTGLCWSLKIVAVRVLDADGRGNWSQEIAGIDYAIKAGAKVINCSFGGSSGSEIVRDAIARARNKGVLLVAAAGNDGKNADKHPAYPAAYPDGNVLSVAATNSKDKLASFSNYGAKTVDLAAPGDHVASTFWHSDYAYMSGTSMAPPTSPPPPRCCARAIPRGTSARSAPACERTGTS